MSTLTANLIGFVGTDTGRGYLFEGHDHSPDALAREIDESLTGSQLLVDELHWHEQRRVKWCSNYGDPCDLDGEWHRHWHPVRPAADGSTAFTVAYVKQWHPDDLTRGAS